MKIVSGQCLFEPRSPLPPPKKEKKTVYREEKLTIRKSRKARPRRGGKLPEYLIYLRRIESMNT